MTAIALLNIYVDPHLIADSMLSRHTNQTTSKQTIWLPARGDIEAVQDEGKDGWRISALARKTVYLPNQGGIFAWSGRRPQAVEFWKNLSAKFLVLRKYNADVKLSLSHLSKSFEETVEEVQAQGQPLELSIVGYAIYDDKIIPIGFNDYTTITTKRYGTCFLIGSGIGCLIDCIKQKDNQETDSQQMSVDHASSTQDLAQYISSRLLFLETLKSGYETKLVPINLYSGGYFEWHKVTVDGVIGSPPHLDFNVRLEENQVRITRIYFSEIMHRPGSQGQPESFRTILLFNQNDIILGKDQVSERRIAFCFKFAKGALLYQALSDCPDYTNPDGTSDVAGGLEAEHLKSLFNISVNVNSVRTFFILPEASVPLVEARSYSNSHKVGSNHLASIIFKDEVLQFDFDASLIKL